MTAVQKIAQQNSEVDDIIQATLAHGDFWEYCLWWDSDFYSRRPFLREIARVLQRVVFWFKRGRALKVMINLPPRAGKSYIVTLFCTYWLTQFPELSVMRNTCTASLYQEFSYQARAIIQSEKFKENFPDIRLAEDRQNLNGWKLTTSKQVAYFGGGVGTNIIGKGANIAITDDLYPGLKEALSKAYNDSVDMWKEGSHNSRMEANCPEIFVGTRWAKRDMLGKAIKKGLDYHIRIPAMYVNELGNLVSFCEDVKPTHEYIRIKKDTARTIWMAEYMQEPVELEGLLFPLDNLRYFNPAEFNPLAHAEYIFMPIDPADKGGDDLAAPVLVLCKGLIYVTKVICNNNGTNINGPACVEQIISNKVNACEIEGNAAWYLFGEGVRAKVNYPPPQGRGYTSCEIRIIKNTTNKGLRIDAQSAIINNYFVFDSTFEEKEDYNKFMQVLGDYLREGGSTQRDDAPDSLAHGAKYFLNRFPFIFNAA